MTNDSNLIPVVGAGAGTGIYSSDIVNFKTQYKPGFKIGVGMDFDHDNWDASAEYTRLHGTHHRGLSRTTNATGTNTFIPLWVPPLLQGLFEEFSTATEGTIVSGHWANVVKSTWRLNLDFLDVDLGRWYYVGQSLTFRPYFGARAAWITQHRKQTASSILGEVAATGNYVVSREKTESWGIGPRAGIYTHWMLGEDFRLYGNAEGDILFTRYKWELDGKLVYGLDNVFGVGTAGAIAVEDLDQHNINTLRTHLDLELGVGWGTYFDCNNWHLDLTIGYDFQVFFNQNMFRKFTSQDPYTIIAADVDSGVILTPGIAEAPISIQPDGDLYLQGLTITARLDY